MNQVPVAICSPMARAAVSSLVHTDAVKPNSLSFMSATACSSEPTFMIPTTGPKLSSLITRMS